VPIKNTAGGKTFPKRGRLGSGAYWPKGVPIAGNVFGPNSDQNLIPTPPAPRPFGSPSNAGNGTRAGESRVTLGANVVHPNSGQLPISKMNYVPAMTIQGNNQQFQTPYDANPVVQPHERNSFMHKVRPLYYTASGVSRTMPADTAFKRNPPKKMPRPRVAPQQNVLRIPRAQQASFVSRNNLWVDPNNSFLQGRPNINGDVGRGRWSTIKRGAAG